LIVLLLLTVLAFWLQREAARGTFDAIERGFVSWLAANTGPGRALPPLTLVLYDDEASELAGNERMAMLDGALFTRAASRLGAAGAGIEGLAGDPTRMVEAAGAMPVFGGFDLQAAPGQGWTPLRGEAGIRWLEVPGLAGRPARFARGFLAPPEGSEGARTILVAGRNGDRAVPSFLALAWAAAQAWRWSELTADGTGLRGPDGRMMLDGRGALRFLPHGEPTVMNMNELLVAAEKFEREGGESPLRGHIVVLARATSEVTRLAGAGRKPVTPAEQWAMAWESVRRNQWFHAPGRWFPLLLALGAAALGYLTSSRHLGAALTGALLALLLFALVALGMFATTRVMLPLAPTLLMGAAGFMVGRAGHRMAGARP
jgi:hypothetical protein